MKALTTVSAALAGLMVMIIGGMLPSAFIIPNLQFPQQTFDLSSTLQIPSILICGLVCGPKAGLIAIFAYLTIGLFYLPIFHGGGSTGYLTTPEMGYLVGFIPAIWVSGILSEKQSGNSLIYLTCCSVIGLFIIHLIGISNLILGGLTSKWSSTTLELIFSYSLSPFPIQVILCTGVALIAKIFRSVLLK